MGRWINAKLIIVDKETRRGDLSELTRFSFEKGMERIWPDDIEKLRQLNVQYVDLAEELINDGHIVIKTDS